MRVGLVLGRSGAVHLGGPEPGVRHAERCGDPLGHDLVERLASQLLDEHPEGDEVEVAVPVDGARRVVQRLRHDRGEARGHVGVPAPQRQPGDESRGVREQLAHRHLLLAVRGEVGEVGGDRFVEAQATFLDELDDRDRGEELRHRGHVEDRVLGGRDPEAVGQGLAVVVERHRVPAGVGAHHVPLVPHEPHRAGVHGEGPVVVRDLVRAYLGDGGLDRRRVEPDVARLRGAQRRPCRHEPHPLSFLPAAAGQCGRGGGGGERRRHQHGREGRRHGPGTVHPRRPG